MLKRTLTSTSSEDFEHRASINSGRSSMRRTSICTDCLAALMSADMPRTASSLDPKNLTSLPSTAAASRSPAARSASAFLPYILPAYRVQPKSR